MVAISGADLQQLFWVLGHLAAGFPVRFPWKINDECHDFNDVGEIPMSIHKSVRHEMSCFLVTPFSLYVFRLYIYIY